MLVYDKNSLFIFCDYWWLRKWFVWLAEWSWFQTFYIIIVLANSISLPFYDYQDLDD